MNDFLGHHTEPRGSAARWPAFQRIWEQSRCRDGRRGDRAGARAQPEDPPRHQARRSDEARPLPEPRVHGARPDASIASTRRPPLRDRGDRSGSPTSRWSSSIGRLLAREPDQPEPRRRRRDARSRRSGLRCSSSPSSSPRPGSATAASAASPRASSNRSRRTAIPRRIRHLLPARDVPPGHRRGAAGRAPRQLAQVAEPVDDHALRARGAGALLRARRERRRPHGAFAPRWVETEPVLGIPRDIPSSDSAAGFVNLLRLWSATSTAELDLELFNQGDYVGAAKKKAQSESISKILYPNDNVEKGRELRLMQEYFFVACSIARRACATSARAVATSGELPEQRRVPAERHAPRARDRRADARPRRRASTSTGPRRGTSSSAASDTRTTRCCRRRSRSGPRRCSRTSCRATSRSSARSTAASSSEIALRAPEIAGRAGAIAPIAPGPPERVRMAPPRGHRQPRRERRVEAPLRARSQRDLFPELPRALAGALQQQDERRHAARLDPARPTRGSPRS